MSNVSPVYGYSAREMGIKIMEYNYACVRIKL